MNRPTRRSAPPNASRTPAIPGTDATGAVAPPGMMAAGSANSLIGFPFRSLTAAAPPVIAGFVYFAPNSAWKPVHPPGSSGSGSVLAFGLPRQTLPALLPQCTAIPTKSVCASVRAAVPDGDVCGALPSFHSGEPARAAA